MVWLPAPCDELVLVLGHESHNHPSQVLPVEGAATGIGGIMRDIVCMGAEVVGVLDSLRFGELSSERRGGFEKENGISKELGKARRLRKEFSHTHGVMTSEVIKNAG